MKVLQQIRRHIISALETQLPESLTYHNPDHTIDVATRCLTIATAEGTTDEQSLFDLQVAALYHDYGFLSTYCGHEEKSCALAKRELPFFGVNDASIQNICDIILATSIPQSPKNHLQEIICDADLDYLGRDDYFVINENLHKELIEYGLVSSEEDWEQSKIAFLKSHKYFTEYSKRTRQPKKLFHLQQLSTAKSGRTPAHYYPVRSA